MSQELLAVGTKVRSTDELFTPSAFDLPGPLDGEVVGHGNGGYNRVIFREEDGTLFAPWFHDFWLASTDELIVLSEGTNE